MLLPAALQNSRRNGGGGFLIIVADPRTRRCARSRTSFDTSAIAEALTVHGVRDGFEVEIDEDGEQFIDELTDVQPTHAEPLVPCHQGFGV
jgi:hypothetical protein